MNRRALKYHFTLERAPDWMCPTCGQAPLRILKDTFIWDEQRFSRDHSYDQWEPEWIQYVYSCMLVCSNEQCKEVVASCGLGSVNWYVQEDENGIPQQVYEDHFRPRFFQPHLRLFQIPEACPCSVARPLQDSFALFFAAPHAALNNVRIAIDALLTDMKVQRFHSIDGKRTPIGLPQRIALLPSKYAQLKDLISAVKWVGNTGSQGGGTEVSFDDVMHAYELAEQMLQQVYEPK